MTTLCSETNLTLAWNRISTGINHQHKRYFRHIYAAYATALKENIADLCWRMRRGSYAPHEPTRVFLPKPSGLQRPLTLLCVEDQIVLQAVANVFARKLLKRRRPLELKAVYSNVLTSPADSIFFLRDWHATYEAFTRRIRYLYRGGYRWVAEFDLAAYYDTIAHDLLVKTASPRGGFGGHGEALKRWLKKWTAERAAVAHGHGIPQGPIASDFLGECFLLPVDEAMTRRHSYLRYVDDVRLFGHSEKEVRLAAIELEILCRNRGLIPQAKKFAIREVKSIEELLQRVPSMDFASDGPEGERPSMSPRHAALEFSKCLTRRRPRRIADKTRARYVLYRAVPSKRLLRYVLLLLPHHPEHIDAFMFYLSHFPRDQRAIAVSTALARESPYEYVRGEAWQVLARMMTAQEARPLLGEAMSIARSGAGSLSLKWGACTFLCAAEHKGLGRYAKWVVYQKNPLLLALLTPILPSARISGGDTVPQILQRSAAEPGLALADRLVQGRHSLRGLRIPVASLPAVVQRVYRALGIVQGQAARTDPVAELLERSLEVPRWAGWRSLLEPEYAHACGLLAEAAAVVDSNRSYWLNWQNSFNHAVCVAFLRWLQANGRPGIVPLVNRKNEQVPFGVLVETGNPFSQNYPTIADLFRRMNARRNTVPASHPYTTKGGRRTQPLRAAEQRSMLPELRAAFNEIARVVG